ncbi:MAG: YidC/Oxa1 family insertase periplasmic-domain containing protein [Gemmataceae bacterium]|nr:YidC/Oxa1 family insertase periplasmic-domain containing protein [Gemmataceae bacterium]
MQTKNLIVFFVASFVLIAGYVWLNATLAPKAKKNDEQQAKLDEKKDPQDLKEDVKAEPPKEKDPKEKQPEKKDPVPEKKVEEKKVEEKKIEAKKKPEIPRKTVVLGNDDTHLKVLLTNRGAAVQEVVLNHFKTADYLGKPVNEPLRLVPSDPIQPSFRMYHYADMKLGSNPVLGLGEETWEQTGDVEHKDGIDSVSYRTTMPGNDQVEIVKTYSLHPKEYHVRLELDFRDLRKAGDAKTDIRYQLTGARNLPIEGEWYAQTFRQVLIGEVDSSNNLWRKIDDSNRISIKDGGEAVPPSQESKSSSFVQYAAVATQYFASAIVVDVDPAKGINAKQIIGWARATHETTEIPVKFMELEGDKLLAFDTQTRLPEAFFALPRLIEHVKHAEIKKGDPVLLSTYKAPDGRRVATWLRRGTVVRPMMDDVTVRVNTEPFSLLPGESVQHRYMLYHGPVKTKLLAQFRGDEAVDTALVDRYAYGLHLRTLTDYPGDNPVSRFFHSVGWTSLLVAVTSLMHWLLYWLHFITFGNYGLSIILLTVVVRGMMYPISRKQALLSVKMQALKPEIAKLREKHKSDKVAQQQAMMALYRKHNVHPAAGCLPVLLQMPIFLGLYYALQESISFRLAPFLWMRNLAAPDMLFWWGENIPILSDPDNYGGFLSVFYLGPYFNLLPGIAMVLMVMQQKMLTPPPTNEEEEIQQKMMKYMMIFFGVMFFKVASGLAIYFIASSLWGLAERKLLPKKQTTLALAASNGDAKSAAFKPGISSRKPKGKELEEDGSMLGRLKNWWKDLLDQAAKK